MHLRSRSTGYPLRTINELRPKIKNPAKVSILKLSGNCFDPDLVRVYAKKAGKGIDWFTGFGHSIEVE